ncbi:MAG: glycosyltransferase family 4 protein [Candidatus Pacebacteria bacterium]|jgi:glycosyltransferase involved in cell wall biosynthesis|nr:glycosyltransferase family 4 protein [Candidatus Paceibacterota bacterium]
MKLCFLAGADSIHSYRWIKYFADKGHQVSWLTLTPNRFGSISNTEIKIFRNFAVKEANAALNVAPVKAAINRIAPDVFHAHYAGINGIIGALSGFHPFVLTAWGSDILITAQLAAFRPVIKAVLERADVITCDAEMVKKELINLGVPSQKIKIIYFGVDTEKFTPGPKDGAIVEELGLEDSVSVISIRSLEPIYDVETLIRAVPEVIKEVPNAKFIVAGRGSQGRKLKEMAAWLECAHHIRFIGWIPQNDLPRYLRTADIYVSTSLSDSTSVSLLEAMSSGMVPVVTDAGENREILNGGRNGFVVPLRDWRQLARKIVFLIKNSQSRTELKQANRELIEEKYNFRKELDKMEDIYRQLASNSYGK